MTNWKSTTALASLGILLLASPAGAVVADSNSLLNLSLEQLSNLEITSVSKRAEKASEAAAAIYVITQDDIRRSGATSIPEILRVVPGLNVTQSGSHQWAVTARGFNDQFANKLLVLIDGRSIYTPLFSGVYWDVQDTLLEDIERIEVIRGPGATLWGANAVNGVINIITKNASNTQGGMASATVGNQDRGLVSTRYGAEIAENAFMRVYAKYDDRDSVRTATVASDDAQDQWNKAQAGFRADWKGGDRNTYTLQGDVYRAGEDGVINLPDLASGTFITTVFDREQNSGNNLLGRWNYKQSEDSNLTVQMYYDNVQRSNYIYRDVQQTFDFDFQHDWSPIDRHEIVWGSGYRLVKDDFRGTFYASLTPATRSDNLFSAFVQDKIAIVPDSFYITLGSKFERNDYTGFEYQPSARFTWLVDDDQTVWGAVSRAVRTPNRFSDDGTLIVGLFPVGAPAVYVGATNNNLAESEELVAYELGYRVFPTKTVSFDIATFYNDYDKLLTNSTGAFNGIIPIIPVNANSGRTYGVEIGSTWEVNSYWQLNANYSYLNFTLDHSDGDGFTFAGKSPKHQFNARSILHLPHDVEIDNALYYVSDLNGIAVPAYLRFDTRVAWKVTDAVEVSLVGQNLLDDLHQEFNGFTYQNNSQIPRSIYANILWKF